MPMLKDGSTIKTGVGDIITIKHFLDEGGQGEVYKVSHQGKDRALKLYKKSFLNENSNSQAFYDNIKKNVDKGKPSEEFLWPLDITEWHNGTFGYIMDLRPSGYYDITEYILCHVRFKSYRAIIDACLKIVSAFRILHNKGYSYQDLNDGNFFINPDNGDVLICDNDNVAPDKTETGILGKPRYLAPEIVLKKSMPNYYTDIFSMAILIYILFCLNHPLEGKRYLAAALTPALQERLYGSEPLFIMDPNDKSNGPDPVAHKNSIMVWKCLPDYMKNIFIEAFCQKSFEKPNSRPTELDWLKVLTRFRSEIVPCSCGNEVFTQNGDNTTCDDCGNNIKIPFKLQFTEYAIPAVKNSRIYKCQLGVCNAENALNPIASILSKKETNALGIKNRTEKKWNAITSKGVARKVDPNEVIPLKNGIQFTVDDMTIKIIENK